MFLIKQSLYKKITLVEGNKIVTQDAKKAEILNTFCSNPVKNLKMPEFQVSRF